MNLIYSAGTIIPEYILIFTGAMPEETLVLNFSRVYPNPPGEYFKVETESDITDASITIYNAFGAKVYDAKLTN